MLAADVAAHLRGRPGFGVVSLDRSSLDIARRRDVESAMDAHRPSVVVNTAAIHVDECEADPERAYAVNAWGAGVLARACERAGAALIHMSTGGLFGDTLKAYHEYDPVVLKTTYAASKYAGEELVRQHCQRHFVLRLGWLYGGAFEHRRDFVLARYREGTRKAVVESASDKHGSPTYAGDVAGLIPALLDSQEYGLYHAANQGGCTRAGYVRRIFQELGLRTRVEEVDSSHFPRKADVPDCEILTSLNLGYAGLAQLPPWEEALARYVHSARDKVGR